MKFWEAMRALEEGKKVRCKQWEPNQAIYKLNPSLIGRINDATQNWHLYHEDEWELYQGRPNLSFQDVIKGLREGKKYVRKAWMFPECYIEADAQGNVHFYDKRGLPFTWTIRDLEATDWVEVHDGK